MKIITEAMKKDGWKLKEVARVLIEESRHTLGPGWVKVPIVDRNSQIAAQVGGWERLGLSNVAAKVAAGAEEPPERFSSNSPFDLLRKSLTNRPHKRSLTD
jgi:hypothetical protein